MKQYDLKIVVVDTWGAESIYNFKLDLSKKKEKAKIIDVMEIQQ